MSATLPPPEVYKLIGQRIRAARERRGLSQEQLAKHIDLTRTSITNIESGRQKLLVHTLFLLSEALAVPVAEFIAPSHPEKAVIDVEAALPPNIPADARNWVLSGLVSISRGEA